LKDNSWLTVDSDDRILFSTALEQRWEAAAALVGVDIGSLTDYAGHA
jgi:putative transcriptional regulator